jgi:uncharacterized glyoxalase superfamily protein PhnB
MPQATVIPVLGYPDVGNAVEWLCDTFGFTVRWRIGNHRAQLNAGDGAMAVTEHRSDRRSGPNDSGGRSHSVMVRVEDVSGHYARARRLGAHILQPPTDFPYGERQYTAEDLAGHVWTFSESIADAAPEEWGGTSVRL